MAGEPVQHCGLIDTELAENGRRQVGREAAEIRDCDASQGAF